MTFKVETIRREAEIFFPDGDRLIGSFFVSPESPNHSGREFVSEVLTSERRYIPFESKDGKIVLLQKGCIEVVLLKDKELNKEMFHSKQIDA